MPKLLMFAACENVIVDRDRGTPSLISVFSSASFPVLAGDVLPADAGFPTRWALVAMWEITAEDKDKNLIQKTHLLTPTGDEVLTLYDPLILSQPTHTSISYMNSLPIGTPGKYYAVVSLMEPGVTNRFAEVARYPISINHSREEETTLS